MTTKGTIKLSEFKFGKRDKDILRDIGRYGGLTAEQVSILHFPLVVIPDMSKVDTDGKHPPKMVVHSNCQRRLKVMLEVGYIQRVERFILLSQGKKPYYYTLTKKGAEFVASIESSTLADTGWRESEKRVRPNYIEHHIRVNDVRIAIEKAVEALSGLDLVEWHDDLMLNKTHSKDTIELRHSNGVVEHVKLFPDAYFAIRDATGRVRHTFLELDMGSETASSQDPANRTFKRKVATYIKYFFNKQGDGKSLFEQRYGSSGARVLTVTTSQKRLERLLEVSEEVGAIKRFWFTTYAQVVEPIIQFKGMEHREQSDEEREAYTITLPNILSDAVWKLAKDPDPSKPLHALDEPFKR